MKINRQEQINEFYQAVATLTEGDHNEETLRRKIVATFKNEDRALLAKVLRLSISEVQELS